MRLLDNLFKVWSRRRALHPDPRRRNRGHDPTGMSSKDVDPRYFPDDRIRALFDRTLETEGIRSAPVTITLR